MMKLSFHRSDSTEVNPVNHNVLYELPNRLQLENILDIEIRRMRRTNSPLSLLKINIDCFAAYYQAYSHHAAEECLQRIATTLANRIRRAGDFLAYYGEDEFMVVLPNTDRAGAVKLAELLRLMILELKIEHVDSTAAPYLTISVGVTSQIPDRTLNVMTFIGQVSQALQSAKISGRNCTRIFEN